MDSPISKLKKKILKRFQHWTIADICRYWIIHCEAIIVAWSRRFGFKISRCLWKWIEKVSFTKSTLLAQTLYSDNPIIAFKSCPLYDVWWIHCNRNKTFYHHRHHLYPHLCKSCPFTKIINLIRIMIKIEIIVILIIFWRRYCSDQMQKSLFLSR